MEDEARYPGNLPRCVRLTPARRPPLACASSRRYVQFTDRIQGAYRQDVAAAVGDIILKRRDQLFAYVLAVVVDDAAQGVTHIVRGADLLDNTPRQIYLQRLLGLPLPALCACAGAHRSRRQPSSPSRGAACGWTRMRRCRSCWRSSRCWGWRRPRRWRGATLAEAWDWAIAHWDINKVPKRLNLRVSD